MTSLTERKEDAWRSAALLIIIGLGGLFSGREVGIAIAVVVFMFAATHIQRSRIWAAGESGEAGVHNILARLPEDHYVIHDIVLPKDKGTAQLDHVVVNRSGVFAIESKNFTGTISGSDDVCMHYTPGGARRLYPPGKQVHGHAEAIRAILAGRPEYNVPAKPIPVKAVVAFSDRLRVRYKTPLAKVLKLKNLHEYIDSESHENLLTPEQAASLALYILAFDLSKKRYG
jgi:hypothetical protein